MSIDRHPAAENMFYVAQGIELIHRLEPTEYADPASPGTGVGAQFRHCLDFYRCFLRGLESGTIDYASRERETRVEVDREHAVHAFEDVRATLARMDAERAASSIEVRVEKTEAGALAEESQPATCGSTVMRELQFLVSHTVHHYAIIKLQLERSGVDVAELKGLGVAPSTQSYWSRTG